MGTNTTAEAKAPAVNNQVTKGQTSSQSPPLRRARGGLMQHEDQT